MRLPVFYTPAMVAEAGAFSPSAGKPAQVMERLRTLAIEVIEPPPATVDELCLAHDRTFVEDVLAGRELNGFNTTSKTVAASLRYTTGSMLAAARHVLATGGIACAPCSGFHHAGYRMAGGYCTFNGLMVTACALHAAGTPRVAIVDCDMHYGDGTDEIIRALGATWVDHFTAGADYHRPRDAPAFFAALPDRLEAMADCSIVLYQAGADPHVDDPLGGWLTTDELAQRDALVFDTFVALGVPVVWNLAGGYQREADGSIPKVLDIHENTARAAIAALARVHERAR
jgi:acetoin utilization deacetylase AcuC-like enzyme